MGRSRAALIAISAVLIAVTAVFTLLVRVPIPATQGYFNFSDVAVYFTAFTFGPWVGLVAGGIGTALADVVGGWAQFAPLTLVAHGLEGLLAGLLGRGKSLPGQILAWLVGAFAMIAIYFLGEYFLFGYGPAAWPEVPVNILQNVVGGLVGIPLCHAVRRAYPPVARLAGGGTWHEG